MKRYYSFFLLAILTVKTGMGQQASSSRTIIDFDNNWKFFLGDTALAKEPAYNDNDWRTLDLPHDWSIEGGFSDKNPGTPNQGALPTGIGWYRKTFTLPAGAKNKNISIEFDGVYRNSEVWVNGHYAGKRPNGYISFAYDLTPYIDSNTTRQVIAVKVDNSAQPGSRWYTGSGIYRNVRLVLTNKIAIDHWGTFITTPQVSATEATVQIQSVINNSSGKAGQGSVYTSIYDATGKLVGTAKPESAGVISLDTGKITCNYKANIRSPRLWAIETPYLYKAVTRVVVDGRIVDEYVTPFGIRYFNFDVQHGFFLNGKPVKILGVCMHHDLGALGAAVNVRAIERQLQLLKAMGCNAIRTAHNPPAPELLDLCDRMGFIVMDEAFDMWHKKKNKFDYNLDFDQWHKQDLED